MEDEKKLGDIAPEIPMLDIHIGELSIGIPMLLEADAVEKHVEIAVQTVEKLFENEKVSSYLGLRKMKKETSSYTG